MASSRSSGGIRWMGSTDLTRHGSGTASQGSWALGYERSAILDMVLPAEGTAQGRWTRGTRADRPPVRNLAGLWRLPRAPERGLDDHEIEDRHGEDEGHDAHQSGPGR